MANLYTEVQEKKLLLKQMQPPSFRGEGADIEKNAEAWLEQMDDYFTAAGTTPANQSMLGMFRLTGEAKLWWKQHCRDRGVSENSQSWTQIKQAIRERYLPPAHESIKMNEFFGLRQGSLTLEAYYSQFVTLRRYAPQMSSEQQIARFCQGLNSPLDTRLEAMRPTSIQDALIRAKPLVKEVGQDKGFKRKEPYQPRWQDKQEKGNHPSSEFQPRPRVYAANIPGRSLAHIECYECHEMGHYRSNCPKLRNRTAAAVVANPHGQGRAQPQQQFQPSDQNRGRGRGRGRAAHANGRGRGGHVYAAIAEPTLGDEVNGSEPYYAAEEADHDFVTE